MFTISEAADEWRDGYHNLAETEVLRIGRTATSGLISSATRMTTNIEVSAWLAFAGKRRFMVSEAKRTTTPHPQYRTPDLRKPLTEGARPP